MDWKWITWLSCIIKIDAALRLIRLITLLFFAISTMTNNLIEPVLDHHQDCSTQYVFHNYFTNLL